jgi:predicted glycoside hydrolase/deacetylase ChbG (UPF0249 family)
MARSLIVNADDFGQTRGKARGTDAFVGRGFSPARDRQ